MSNKGYTTTSLYFTVHGRLKAMKGELGLKNLNEVVQVLFAAYDIYVAKSNEGDAFTEAVKKVLEEDRA